MLGKVLLPEGSVGKSWIKLRTSIAEGAGKVNPYLDRTRNPVACFLKICYHRTNPVLAREEV